MNVTGYVLVSVYVNIIYYNVYSVYVNIIYYNELFKVNVNVKFYTDNHNL